VKKKKGNFNLKIFENSIFKNYLSLFFNNGSRIIISLLFVPIFLTFWGLERYADWILIISIPSILTLGDLGLTSYGLNLIVIEFNKNINNKNKVNFILDNIIFFTTIFIILFGALMYLVNNFLNIKLILKIKSLNEFEFNVVIFLIFFKYLFNSIFNFISGLYKIKNKFYLTQHLQTFFLITEMILIFITVFLGGNILEASIVSLINYFLALLICLFIVKKNFLWINVFEFKNIDFLFIKKIFYPSISFMTGNMNKTLLINLTTIYLKIFSMDAILILYNSLRLILNGFRQFLNILTLSFQPQITIDFAKNKRAKIIRIFKQILKYNFFLSSISFLILIMFIKVPFLIWTKYSIDWSQSFFVFFLLANYIEWLSIPIITLPYSLNFQEK